MIELRWVSVPLEADGPGLLVEGGQKALLQYREMPRVLGPLEPEPEWVTVEHVDLMPATTEADPPEGA